MEPLSDGDSVETTAERFADGLLAFEMAPAPLFAVLPNGVIVKLNHALRQLLGYAEGELVGRPFDGVLAPDYRAKARERFGAVIGGSEPSPETRYDVLDKSGRSIPVRVSSIAVRDDSGAIRYVIGRVHHA